jgi:hypothetical protein
MIDDAEMFAILQILPICKATLLFSQSFESFGSAPPRYGTIPRGSMRATTYVRHIPEKEPAAANPNRHVAYGVGLLAHDHLITLPSAY